MAYGLAAEADTLLRVEDGALCGMSASETIFTNIMLIIVPPRQGT